MNIILSIARIFCFSVSVFFYYFQVPYIEYAGYITIGLAAFLLLDIQKAFKIFTTTSKSGILYTVLLVLCSLNLLWSLANGIELADAFRFYLIVMLIPLCPFFVNRESEILYKIFCTLSLGKSIMLIVLAAMVVQAGSYSELRIWAQTNNYGDIYTVFDVIPRVQLKGNALLVIAFMVSFYKNQKFTLYNLIILLSVLCAGNLAFLGGIALFFGWLYFKKIDFKHLRIRDLLAGTIVALFLAGFSVFAGNQVALKGGLGSDGDLSSSNGMRYAQFQILTDTNALCGKGFGSSVPDAVYLGRSSDSQYYELQTLYIYYQVGLVILLLFIYISLSTSRQSYSKDGFMVFIIYILFSFFNPYCMDSTQMITMILLGGQFPKDS